MRIGVECSVLTRSRAGIGFYTYHLLRALANLEGEEEYVMLYNRPISREGLPDSIEHVHQGPRSTHLWVQTRLPALCRRHGIDLLHSPGQGLPFGVSVPRILTIHDLAPLLYPQHKDAASRFVWTVLVPLMARQAHHIITVSDNTRKDVIERLGIQEDKVTRIYEAAGPEYFPEPDEERLAQFRRNKALEPGYILAVGTLEPRKNYPFLFRAFKKWLERGKTQATLVVVGKKGWLYDEIFDTVRELGLRQHIRFEGYVGDLNVMRTYYNAARFSILTPYYEGFWLPGLESLACGTPVVAPAVSCIPEVIGDAGLLVDSWQEDDWADAMQSMWDSADRNQWAERGKRRAAAFSWDRAAQQTRDVYRKVLAERSGH